MSATSPNMPTSKNTTMKTERTHEENQERAYIAASRRSDRSLEARVESARRASEIHKRRTGRALRVTEQDVLNEEMYEEEEDDLPLPYRQLTQHLTTGSTQFNKRLAAYLTHHVAVRAALDQIIRDSHNMSANAAAAGTPSVSAFSPSSGEMPGQQASFSSQMPFTLPIQTPMSFAPDSSNPPTPSPMTQMPQVNLAQLSTHGTQFHMGPLGLSTVPHANYYNSQFSRRQTAPKLSIPQQNANNNAYHQLSPRTSQHHDQNQSFQSPNNDITINSPMIISPQTATEPVKPSPGTPARPSSRRLSMPANSYASPVPSHSSSLTNSSSADKQGSPEVSLRQEAKGGKRDVDVKSPIPPSPAVKRKASNELMLEQPFSKSSRSATVPSNPTSTHGSYSGGLLDLSLPQNAQDLLYGGGMFIPGQPSIFGASFDQLSQPPSFNFDDKALSKADQTSYNADAENDLYNFSDPDFNFGSLMTETGMPITVGTNFSKTENFDTGDVDELLQEFYGSDNREGTKPHATSTPPPQHGEAGA